MDPTTSYDHPVPTLNLATRSIATMHDLQSANSLDMSTASTSDLSPKDEDIEEQDTFKLNNLSGELRHMTWRSIFTPQTIVITQEHLSSEVPTLLPVALYVPFTCQHSQSLVSKYSHPVTLAVSKESREETLLCYKQILGVALRGSMIYFNPKLDTLALSPLQPFYFVRLSGVCQKVPIPHPLPLSMITLKELVLTDRKTMRKIESIMVGNATWPYTRRSETANQWTQNFFRLFKLSIHNAFPSLRELVLVLPQDTSNSATGHVGRNILAHDSERTRKYVINAIKHTYMHVQRKHPNHVTRIPEVIIIKHDDPRAPRFETDRTVTEWTQPATPPVTQPVAQA